MGISRARSGAGKISRADEVNQAVCARLGCWHFSSRRERQRNRGHRSRVLAIFPRAECGGVSSTRFHKAHAFVLERVAAGVEGLFADELLPQAPGILIEPVQQAGNSDLLWNGRKFSGNSLRIKHTACSTTARCSIIRLSARTGLGVAPVNRPGSPNTASRNPRRIHQPICPSPPTPCV